MSNKRIFLSCILLILFNQAGFGQPVKRNILKSISLEDLNKSLSPSGQWHPFPTNVAEWEKAYSDDILKNIIKSAEDIIKDDYPQVTATISMDYMRNGDSKARYEPVFFLKREMLWKFALAESVEGKGRFTDKIIDGIWAICEETFWGTTSILKMQKKGKGLPDVTDPIVDLYAAETASLLAWVDYFNGEELDKTSKLIRERIRVEVNRRVFKPMLTADYFYITAETPNNWAPWVMSNYVAAQLLLETNLGKRNNAILYALNITDKYINGLGSEGSSDEGPGYWGQAAGCVFDELNLLYQASNGKISVFDYPFIQKMGSYIYKIHLSDENYVNVGDAIPGKRPNALMLFRYGKLTGDKTLMNFASWNYHTYSEKNDAPYLNNSRNSRSRSLYNMSAIKEIDSYPFHNPDNEDAYLEDVQIMKSKAKDGLIIASYGGNNGQNHNHNDVGNVLVYLNDWPVILDVGPGNYTAKTFSDERYSLWFNTSQYHNLPIINGYGQADGKEFASRDVNYTTNNAITNLNLDISNAYPIEAGIKKWNRSVTLNKITGKVSIQDNYEMTSDFKSLQQIFMTICKADISKPGKIIFTVPGQNNVVMEYESKWEVKKEIMPLNNPEDKKFKETFKGLEIYRLVFTNREKLKKNSLNYSFYKQNITN